MNSKEEETPIWRELYNIAVLETNPVLVEQRVAEAEWAVISRMGELRRSSDGHGEKQALVTTREALRVLRVPDWV